MTTINSINRDEIIERYIQKLLTDAPRYDLYSYAAKYLAKKKSSLNNHELEAEILSIYPDLLEISTNEG